MTNTILATLALAAMLTIGLVACAPTTEKAPADTEAAAPVVLDSLDLDGNGMVSEREKELAAKNAVRDYTLPDGTVVQVDPTLPLLEPVKAAVRAKTDAPVAASHDFGTKEAAIAEIKALLASEAAATGRGIALVYQTNSAGEGLIWVMMASGQKQAPFIGTADKATVVAKVRLGPALVVTNSSSARANRYTATAHHLDRCRGDGPGTCCWTGACLERRLVAGAVRGVSDIRLSRSSGCPSFGGRSAAGTLSLANTIAIAIDRLVDSGVLTKFSAATATAIGRHRRPSLLYAA